MKAKAKRLSKAKRSSSDRISNLPSSIIDNILCLVPIKEAVRTSILSKDWRYNWSKIPKVVFNKKDMLDKTPDVFFNAIHQVLLLHRGPILEFSLSMMGTVYGKCVELDQIIIHLARSSDTVKKFTLHLSESRYYSHKLPLSISLLNQLTDLCVTGIFFDHDSRLSGLGSLTSLYVVGIIMSKDSLLHLLSSCPILKHFELVPSFDNFNGDIPIIELFKCLPVIEHLTIFTCNVKCDRVPGKLPTAISQLKYFCLKKMSLNDDFGLRHLGFVIRNSPNLEKIVLEIHFDEDDIKLDTLEHCGDIWLEHLKELEIVGFAARKGEMEFVKLILAKSPVLMKVRIILRDEEVPKDEELEITRTLLGSPRVSPLAEMIVERRMIAK